MMFAIKAEVGDPSAETFAFSAQKTMYGGIVTSAEGNESRISAASLAARGS